MPDLRHEDEMRREGHCRIAGIDEAGRGPLAGPVSAAAVVLPPGYTLPGLDDSKALTARRREALYEALVSDPSVCWASAMVHAPEIDQLNILQATWKAMQEALSSLDPPPDAALVDGLPVRGLTVPHRALVKGDSISLSIAAASVLAKVERDRFMVACADRFPGYGFERHKGYGTAAHRAALAERGPCPEHRRSFSPVAQAEFDFADGAANASRREGSR